MERAAARLTPELATLRPVHDASGNHRVRFGQYDAHLVDERRTTQGENVSAVIGIDARRFQCYQLSRCVRRPFHMHTHDL